MSVFRYFHTIRHLRPVQVYGRLLSKLPARGSVDANVSLGVRSVRGSWQMPARRVPSLVGPHRFRFLNVEHDVADASAWQRATDDRLWLYNLHYFDDLNAVSGETRTAWHRELLQRWVAENREPDRVGWEPYPTSLRIVNWIKWALAGNTLDGDALKSLAAQASHLSRRMETHLLGNHLFANAKALLFAGCFFEGFEADVWFARGGRILAREIREQMLPDGGHFERSPMYHAIILEDLLDGVNVLRAYDPADDALTRSLEAKASAMLGFLADILHPDGELPFFNDTALSIAPSPSELISYAGRLGISVAPPASDPLVAKPDFGLWVLRGGGSQMIIDAGPIGPDYLPGHAHCDTLSYELSVDGKRAIVNSGTFAYSGPERHAFRATAAHNTVRIDGLEQHEIWAAFRVARRGYPIDVAAQVTPGSIRWSAAHTGYRRLPGKPLHRRSVTYGNRSWQIEDRIEGTGSHRAESFIHLHPDAVMGSVERDSVTFRIGNATMTIQAMGDDSFTLEEGSYSREFGHKAKCNVLIAKREGALPLAFVHRIGIR